VEPFPERIAAGVSAILGWKLPQQGINVPKDYATLGREADGGEGTHIVVGLSKAFGVGLQETAFWNKMDSRRMTWDQKAFPQDGNLKGSKEFRNFIDLGAKYLQNVYRSGLDGYIGSTDIEGNHGSLQCLFHASPDGTSIIAAPVAELDSTEKGPTTLRQITFSLDPASGKWSLVVDGKTVAPLGATFTFEDVEKNLRATLPKLQSKGGRDAKRWANHHIDNEYEKREQVAAREQRMVQGAATLLNNDPYLRYRFFFRPLIGRERESAIGIDRYNRGENLWHVANANITKERGLELFTSRIENGPRTWPTLPETFDSDETCYLALKRYLCSLPEYQDMKLEKRTRTSEDDQREREEEAEKQRKEEQDRQKREDDAKKKKLEEDRQRKEEEDKKEKARKDEEEKARQKREEETTRKRKEAEQKAAAESFSRLMGQAGTLVEGAKKTIEDALQEAGQQIIKPVRAVEKGVKETVEGAAKIGGGILDGVKEIKIPEPKKKTPVPTAKPEPVVEPTKAEPPKPIAKPEPPVAKPVPDPKPVPQQLPTARIEHDETTKRPLTGGKETSSPFVPFSQLTKKSPLSSLASLTALSTQAAGGDRSSTARPERTQENSNRTLQKFFDDEFPLLLKNRSTNIPAWTDKIKNQTLLRNAIDAAKPLISTIDFVGQGNAVDVSIELKDQKRVVTGTINQKNWEDQFLDLLRQAASAKKPDEGKKEKPKKK
jgi:hypothetical protein